MLQYSVRNLQCYTLTPLSAIVLQVKKQFSVRCLLAQHANLCMHTQPSLTYASWVVSNLACMQRCLMWLGLHCRKRLTWGMYAQCAYPYSARWELPVSCRCASKCTYYKDRVSLLNLLTCTGQGILNACFHILLCMIAEVTVCIQRGLCLCRNCQSVRHVGLLSMLLSRLSQLAALCHE